jgi:hypothetical protein
MQLARRKHPEQDLFDRQGMAMTWAQRYTALQ